MEIHRLAQAHVSFDKAQDGDVFYDKLHFKFLQMPLFTQQEHELETHFDKWVYFLKHLEDFDHIPAILNEPIFQKGFEIAEVSHLSSDRGFFIAYSNMPQQSAA